MNLSKTVLWQNPVSSTGRRWTDCYKLKCSSETSEKYWATTNIV